MWELFRHCPIAHNSGAGNENCEYTDDWWYSKNCYLCHSGVECEDLRYCYRTIRVKDCRHCVFSFDSERCVDLINCHDCFQVRYAYNSRNCTDCSFVYDCRNCTDCAFCWNLRNKQYCLYNEQLTKDEYAKRMNERDFRSRSTYDSAAAEFHQLLNTRAWHRAHFIDRSENADGNYLDECKNIMNGFFLTNGMEDCANTMRGAFSKDCLDCVSPYNIELSYYSSTVQDQSYAVHLSYDLAQCKYMEYCAHCFQCEQCFACCGLVGKKYHIFNTPYEPGEYEALKRKIIDQMKRTGEYGLFFPGHFAANPYNESLAGLYWPLDKVTAERWGFRIREHRAEPPAGACDSLEVPESCATADDAVSKIAFWDAVAQRPFQIQIHDIRFAQDIGVPLPSCFYARRLQKNFSQIPFNGELRTASCGQCSLEIATCWPPAYDGRILCEECYLKEVY